ncbi:MAG TPA: methionine--tRNA ligase [bacterium]|jgi:methionyl-tRNA synthetase|nr:methionine--tRNA ligase [bacterium]
MSDSKRVIFIGGAWPYANGSLHLGHIAALIGGDVLARFHRLQGDRVLFVSGSDCHGTPIALEAERQRCRPEDIAERFHKEFRETLCTRLGFSYDVYTQTMTANHREVVQGAFTKLLNEGLIEKRTQQLAFCEKDQRFLPDRYVEGTCPNCHTEGARGDQCDACGKILEVTELISPRCKLCGQTPVWKDSEHFFLLLSKLQDRLFAWLEKSEGWRRNATTYVKNIVSEGLRDRAITRDTTWGIPLPLAGYEGKSIYVWFEAVSGYLSASVEWAKAGGDPEAWKAFWTAPVARHYYIHGKDNIPFHAIIWPGILMGLGYHLPDRLYSSEYLTFGQKQFSKSRGLVIKADDIVERHGSDAVRYYLVANGPENADADFTWEDFQVKVNSELIGKMGNFVNRTLSFALAKFPGGIGVSSGPADIDPELRAEAEAAFVSVAQDIQAGEFRKALWAVIRLSETGNRYVDAQAPWKAMKENPSAAEKILVNSLWLALCIAKLSRPFMPVFSEKVLAQLRQDGQDDWKVPAVFAFHVLEVAPVVQRVELPKEA